MPPAEPPVRPFSVCAGVRALVTGRAGGVSSAPYESLNLGLGVGDDPAAVAGNRRRVAALCGLHPGGITWMRQVHGRTVRYADQPTAEPDCASAAPEADAIFTDVPELALGVLAADCVPVLLADSGAGLVGAAHAGRAGLTAGVVPELVTAMTTAGADPARMTAVIGPAICGGCYEVSGELAGAVGEAVPHARCSTRRGTPGLDIPAGVRAQLGFAGVSRVDSDPRCTAESPGLFSYRRDGVTGRFAALIWLTGRR